jgi:hypothetical protein
MSLSRRGKVVASAVVVAVALGTLGYFVIFPQDAPAFVKRGFYVIGLADEPEPPPPPCPLTGVEAPRSGVPDRPALAVKIENLPAARPQAGLQTADIVYEEPVEGGITRFIVIYQCQDDRRVGPVRSARTLDPDVLSQFGVPILGYSGGAPHVVRALGRANLITLDETTGAQAMRRDPSKVAPHNLYADTRDLYQLGKSKDPAPDPVFTYAEEVPSRSRKVSTIHLPFSTTVADVYWNWSRRAGAWMRSHGDVRHLVEGGEQVSADNVVVQVVKVVVGPRGGITPHVELTGSGKAYVFRNGRMIVGRWVRPTLRDVTRFVSKGGEEITLQPGRTWVELFPSMFTLGTSR